MTIGRDWVVLDTNIWIFGFRNQPDQPACTQVLQHLPRLHVKGPRQILLEPQANLTEEEMRDFFHLVHRYLGRIDMLWHKVELPLIRKYQQLGCKLGDAAVAAHTETLEIDVLRTFDTILRFCF